nr:MarR family transcriptional regulator [Bacteriovorax sp. HI3]
MAKNKTSKIDSEKILLLDNQLCFKLYAASKAMTQAYAPLLAPLDLTYPQYLTMMVLWESDDLAVKELGERLSLDSGTLSPLIKKLEAKKILTKKRSEEDERVVTIKLTQKGIDLKKKALQVPQQIACQLELKEKEFFDLQKRLNQLIKNLNQAALVE